MTFLLKASVLVHISIAFQYTCQESACADDVTVGGYEDHLGAAGPMIRFSFYNKAYGQWSVI